jgi:hypothetical protein
MGPVAAVIAVVASLAYAGSVITDSMLENAKD